MDVWRKQTKLTWDQLIPVWMDLANGVSIYAISQKDYPQNEGTSVFGISRGTVERAISDLRLLPESYVERLPSIVQAYRKTLIGQDDREQREILKEDVRKQVNPALAKAQERHLDEVRGLIEQLKSVIKTPPIDDIYPGTSLPTMDIEANPLFISLEEHIPSLIFWGEYSTWTNKMTKYLGICKRLREEIAEEMQDWKSPRRVTIHAAQPILSQIKNKALGYSVVAHGFDIHKPRDSIFEMLVVDGIGVIETEDAPACIVPYTELSVRIIKSKESTNIIHLFKEITALQPKILNELDIILLRRDYIMYTCNLCPGQLGESQ